MVLNVGEFENELLTVNFFAFHLKMSLNYTLNLFYFVIIWMIKVWKEKDSILKLFYICAFQFSFVCFETLFHLFTSFYYFCNNFFVISRYFNCLFFLLFYFFLSRMSRSSETCLDQVNLSLFSFLHSKVHFLSTKNYLSQGWEALGFCRCSSGPKND